MEIFEEEEKTNNRPTKILLVINLIIWGIILFMIVLWNGVVNALTPVEMNFNYTQNGNAISYNIRPDGGTTGFIYENEFYGQTISHSAYKHYLPASGNIGEITTTNINGYFQNPCANGEDISYTMKINFYKQPSDENTMAWVRVTNGIDGCTGYFEVINGVYTYNNVCNLKAGDVPKFSLYFNESSRGQTYYRVGIPINFNYTCQIGNQAVIDANNANTNKIVNSIADNINSATNSIQNTFTDLQYNCNYIDNNNVIGEYGYLDTNGNVINGNVTSKVTDYINIDKTIKLELLTKTGTGQLGANACFYTKNKEKLSCFLTRDTTLGEITIPNNSYYFRATIVTDLNKPTFKYCKSSTDAIIENQNQNTSYILEYMNQNKLELEATYTGQNADKTKLEDLEDIEDDLEDYTDINLNNFDISIDTNTSNWVWNTVTSILNTSSLIFGFVISILSIGLIKLILNR